MLNFGHLRQTSPPESCRAQDLPSPLFHPGRQSVWPAAEGSQTLCRGQRPHFLFCFPGHSPPIQRLCAVPAVPGDPPGPPVGGTALKSEAPYVKQSLFDFTITSAKIQIQIHPHAGTPDLRKLFLIGLHTSVRQKTQAVLNADPSSLKAAWVSFTAFLPAPASS